jgi:cytoskeletal protein RodZ
MAVQSRRHTPMVGAGFGEHLKREREMRGVSLEEIAGATRISRRFLEALETETWDRLPGGVFNRGFVRTVARFLGLEEESLLAEYSLAKGDPETPGPAASEPRPLPSVAKRRLPWMALAAILVVLALVVGGWLGRQWISSRQAALNAAAVSLPAAPAPPPAPSNVWTASGDSAVDSAASTESPQAIASPWSEPGPGVQLKIDAAKDTSLTITADGQPGFSGTLSAGQSRSVSAKATVTVEAQDAGAIRLELNGQALGPIGPSGQPGSITLGQPGASMNEGGHD